MASVAACPLRGGAGPAGDQPPAPQRRIANAEDRAKPGTPAQAGLGRSPLYADTGLSLALL
ncbi:MAG: hypothetical protein ACK550_01120 [Synechococcaceae cyanobacterium]